MKFITLLTSLLIIARLGQAQEYVPFPDSNAVWSVNTDKFYVSGDTVIEGLQYKKYFRTIEDTSLYILTGTYYAAIREDENKKIWAVKNDTLAPVLLYDFSLNILDTLTVHPLLAVSDDNPESIQTIIIGIDSILIGSVYRKRFKISRTYYQYYEDDGNFEYWIEGIGSTFGLFSPGVLNRNLADYPWYELLCYHENDTLNYSQNILGNSYNSCYEPVVMGIEEQEPQNISLYPNPTNGEFTIENIDGKYELSIFDILGNKVSSFSCNSYNTYNVTNLNNGIYFVQISSEKGTHTEKIVVEK